MADIDTYPIDVSDGDGIQDGYLNGIQRGIALQIDSSTLDATEYTSTSATYATKKSLIFTPDSSDNIILGIKLDCNLRTTKTAGEAARVRITMDIKSSVIGGDYTLYSTSDATDSATDTAAGIWFTPTFSKNDGTNDINFGGVFGESSYTINVQLAQDNGSDTATISDIVVTIYYLNNGYVTTSSARFS